MGTIANIEVARARKNQRVAVKKAREERHRHEGIEILLGIHGGMCEGTIVYRSRLIPDTSSGKSLLGVKDTPMREEMSCSCTKCNMPFNPNQSPFQQRISDYFAGKE
jgi:hypothetical protein